MVETVEEVHGGGRDWSPTAPTTERASSPLPPLELHLCVSYAEPEYARWMLSRSPSSVVHPPPGAATAGEHLASAGIALSSKMSAMPCLAGEKRKRDGG
uniref:Uncharacterized protein n=1 Tax=Oryza barthii TaxID=65489 RepID=A0A0D3G401_9ORYZ